MAAGLGMAANGGRDGVGLPVGTAMAGVVLASSVLVVAPGLVASLHHLVATPARYGATWDRSISWAPVGRTAGVREHLGALDGVERAAAMYGTELGRRHREPVGHRPGTAWTRPHLPVAPTITRGREPLRASEIALGDLSCDVSAPRSATRCRSPPHRRRHHRSPSPSSGTAVINATDEGSPGLGAVLSPEGMVRVAPGTAADHLRGRPGRRRARSSGAGRPRGRLQAPAVGPGAAAGGAQPRPLAGGPMGAWPASSPPSPPAAWPTRCSCSSGATAASSRCSRPSASPAPRCPSPWRGRRPRCVAVALAAGLAVGALAARSAWRAVADHLGVASGAVVPLLPILLVGVAVLVFANLVAVGPARRAAAIRPAEALRAE